MVNVLFVENVMIKEPQMICAQMKTAKTAELKMAKDKKSDIINRYRIFPRLFGLLFCFILYINVTWFMGLEEPTIHQTAYATGMVASAAAFFKFYVDSGNTDSSN